MNEALTYEDGSNPTATITIQRLDKLEAADVAFISVNNG
jgi:hypothetical protein